MLNDPSTTVTPTTAGCERGNPVESRRRLTLVKEDRQPNTFLEGDPETVGKIRSVIEGVVRRFGLSRGGWGQELAQEALGRVFIGLADGRFRGEAALTTYAEKVAKYTCLEHVRRRKRSTELNPAGLTASARWSSPEESLLLDEQHRRNLRAFAALSAPCRRLFHLIFIEQLSYREVAGRLGITEGALRIRIHRCRLRGKELMASEADE